MEWTRPTNGRMDNDGPYVELPLLYGVNWRRAVSISIALAQTVIKFMTGHCVNLTPGTEGFPPKYIVYNLDPWLPVHTQTQQTQSTSHHFNEKNTS